MPHRHCGRIDGPLNNAGRSYAAAVEEIDPATFQEVFRLIVLGPIGRCRAAHITRTSHPAKSINSTVHGVDPKSSRATVIGSRRRRGPALPGFKT